MRARRQVLELTGYSPLGPTQTRHGPVRSADDSGVTCGCVLNRTDPDAFKNRETLAKYEQRSEFQTLLPK